MTAGSAPELVPVADRVRLRLGTRKSALALAQSGQVAAALEARHPGLRVELEPIVTRGDREAGELAKIGGKGLFTEDLERGLLDGSLDLAVHSLKDLPVTLPDGLIVAAFPARVDPRDVLVAALDDASEPARDDLDREVADRGLSDQSVLDRLPRGASVLTGSLRRRGQLLAARPDLEVLPIRGNVDTRLQRWQSEGHGGVVLAAAGLARLGVEGLPAHPLDSRTMTPAPGQGVLAIEVRAGSRAEPFVRALDDAATARCAEAERWLVAALGGDCTLPFGAYAEIGADAAIHLEAVLISTDGSRRADGAGCGVTPEAAGEACLEALRRDGLTALLATLR